MNYEEKLNLAKEALKSGSYDKETIEYIFPELKESEDERIRKEIIKAIHNYAFRLEEKIPTEWLDWLEKQKNKDTLIKELGEYKTKYIQETIDKQLNKRNMQENNDDKRLRKTTIDFLKEFADKGYENAVECIDWLEKQKPVELSKSAYTNNKNVIEYADKYSHQIWEKLMDNYKRITNYSIGCNDVSDIVLNSIIDTYNWLEKQKPITIDINTMVDKFAHTEVKGYGIPSMIEVDAYRRGIEDTLNVGLNLEQKPVEWSKWDEDILFNIQQDYQDKLNRNSCKSIEQYYINVINWIEELKGRALSQSKKEWSEEDEKMLNSCIAAIYAADYYDINDKSEMEEFLKSLKPQSHWKPSDEQMYFLNWLQLNLGDGLVAEKARNVIESLYNDLKKLKEE